MSLNCMSSLNPVISLLDSRLIVILGPFYILWTCIILIKFIMTFLLERSVNSYLQTNSHAPIEGPERVAFELRPPAFLVLHIHRCIGRDQQLHHRCFTCGVLPHAAGCCLGPTLTHCEGRLGTKPFSTPLRAGFSFKKLHQGQGPFPLYESMWKIVKKSYQHNA